MRLRGFKFWLHFLLASWREGGTVENRPTLPMQAFQSFTWKEKSFKIISFDCKCITIVRVILGKSYNLSEPVSSTVNRETIEIRSAGKAQKAQGCYVVNAQLLYLHLITPEARKYTSYLGNYYTTHPFSGLVRSPTLEKRPFLSRVFKILCTSRLERAPRPGKLPRPKRLGLPL